MIVAGNDPLVAPLTDLLNAFGPAPAPGTETADLVRLGAQWAEEVYAEGSTAVAELAWAWTGTAATEAIGSVERVLGDVLTAADRGLALAELVLEGTVTVATGAAELMRIVDSFVAFARQAAPVAALPQGQLMLLTVAVEHLVAGLDVLTRTTATLADLTERATALTPEIPADPQADHPGPVLHAFDGDPARNGVEVVLPDGSVSRAPNETAAAAVRHALSQQGTPYVWGGTSPGAGLDCSGLTQYAYGQAGVELPRLAQEQDVGARVDPAAVLPGDLAVWDGHVAMVVGNGMMIEAGDPVSVTPIRTTNGSMAFHGFFRPTGN